MKSKIISASLAIIGLLAAGASPALADAPSPAQSMTHLKTAPGVSPLLESAGVVLYAQGGATSGVMGESISNPKGQVVFHIPISSSKTRVRHLGSTVVIFNTANDRQVQLQNPVIDLKEGVVRAVVPQANEAAITIFRISNLSSLKAESSTDKATGIRTRKFVAANLNFAPGVAETVVGLLGLPSGALPDQALFAVADISLKKRVP